MRAMQVTELTGPEGLAMVDVEPPAAADRILMRVHEAGVSFPDLLLTEGRYQRRPELPFIPGVEAAGTVLAAPASSGFTVGDRIAGFVGLGGWADVVAVDPLRAFPLPPDISMREGAALPMNYLTAHLALAMRGQVRAGEVAVVHGAAGGLGTALIQVARALGAVTIAVASTANKRQVALGAGADHAVNVHGWRDAVVSLTDGRGADVVADTVGGDRIIDSLRALRPGGRLLVLGFVDGIPQIPANRLLLRNLDVLGVAWGPTLDAHPEMAVEQWRDILAWSTAGDLRPVLGSRYDLDDAAAALLALSDRQATGKVTLRLHAETGHNH